MSEFEKIFWENSLNFDLPELLGVLRDKYYTEMLKYNDEYSLICSSRSVLLSIAYILENKLK